MIHKAMQNITIALPEILVCAVERFSKEYGMYFSRSDTIREAIRRKVKRMPAFLKGLGLTKEAEALADLNHQHT